MARGARLAVDIGGTFTDLAVEPAEGPRVTAKVLTTPEAPERGVLDGLRLLLDRAGLAPADIDLFVHGTTLATNALIERKGARTALITTAGFRDVLALGNESRYDQYDLHIALPEPLVPRRWRLPVPERLDNDGNVLLPLDETALRDTVATLAAERIESLAIGFLHSFRNPVHERRAHAIVREMRPDLPVTLSCEVSPEMREWERFSTTVANAYVQPLMAGYLGRLRDGIAEAGFACPLFLMLSGGGLTTLETAARFPIRLVESGPAGGAIFAARLARERGLSSVLSFDMGGTTAKICLIDGFSPRQSRSFEVARVGRFKKGSGLPLRIPVIDMVEIGAGGGSIARVDKLGRIMVGPDSAGADPGPACYGRGGRHPTVTDANLMLGRYDPALFAGGSLALDPAASRAALGSDVGTPLGLAPEMAALGIVETVDETMANAARVHAIESGTAYGGRTLIAFGGGGPVHACRLAEKLGIARIVVPAGAGVGSAIGFLRAPVGYEVVRSLYGRMSALDGQAVDALLDDMLAEAHAVVAPGAGAAVLVSERLAFMRYVGQGHEIAVEVPDGRLGAAEVAMLRARFDAEYARIYDRPVPNSDVEVLSFAVTLATAAEPTMPVEDPAERAPPPPTGSRAVRDTASGSVAGWAVHERAALAPGVVVEGPAIVAEAETSTLVGPGWLARVDGFGSLDLTRSHAR